MDGIDISAWSDFGVAVAGAMAALTGLLFVAISINLERIIALPSLPRLAIATLGLFSTVLVASVCLLIPNQSTDALGTEFLVVGLGFGIPMVVLQLRRPRWTPYTGPVDWVATRLAPAVVVPGCVIKLSDSHVPVEASPMLGADNGRIYGELLGVMPDEMDAMRNEGAI